MMGLGARKGVCPLARPLRSPCCCPGPAVPPSGTREVGTGQLSVNCRATATKLRRGHLRSVDSGEK